MTNLSKYLCIFGGGAVRGYAYLGVLKGFEEIGFYPEKLAGSSVGGVFAAFCAVGMSLEEINDVLFDINFELFRDINLKFWPSFSISKGGVLLDWLRENIEKTYYKEDYKKGKNAPVLFKDLKRDLTLIATDLTNSVPFVFSKETTPNYEVAMAIRASAAMPGLLSPVTYEDKILADGDMMKSNPLWRLNKELCPDDLRVLELRLEGVKKEITIKNALQYFNAVYSCMTNYSTDFIMDIYSKYDKFDYIKIDTKDLLLVNFNITPATKMKLIDIGYDAVMQFFKEELPRKKVMLLTEYDKLNSIFSEIDRCIRENNIKVAKNLLGDVFAILTEIKRIIEPNIYKKIKIFRNIFNNNMACGFWGKEKLLNRSKVRAELLEVRGLLDEKCIELKA